VKVDTPVSVRANGPKSLALVGERSADIKLRKVGAWVKNRILLFDLGFHAHRLFAKIAERVGFLVSRRPSRPPRIRARRAIEPSRDEPVARRGVARSPRPPSAVQGGLVGVRTAILCSVEVIPPEPVWHQLKHIERRNVCPSSATEPIAETRAGMERIRPHPELLRAFFEHAGLSLTSGVR
jgi:hypothetical protein